MQQSRCALGRAVAEPPDRRFDGGSASVLGSARLGVSPERRFIVPGPAYHREPVGLGARVAPALLPTSGDRRVQSQPERDLPADRLSLLIHVAMQLTAEQNLDRLLDRIVAASTRVVNADRGTMYLIDWESLQLVSRVAHGVFPIRMPVGVGIAGRTAQTGETIRVDDAYQCPFFYGEVDQRSGYHTHSVLCVPMVAASGHRIGVLQVLNKLDDSGVFSAEDEVLLGAFASQAAISVDNAQRLDATERLIESVIRTMARTIDHRDYITGGHSARVTDYTMRIVAAMGISDPVMLRAIRCAATLHDYGKIGVSEAVLCKPGELSEEEFREMRLHVVFTREILSNLDLPRDLCDIPRIAAEHHERLDGTGYPERLTGDQLSLGGRIIAVADVFDALSSQRQYRDAMDPTSLIGLMRSEAGTKLDADSVHCLLSCVSAIAHDWGPRGVGHFAASYAQQLAGAAAGT